MGKGFSANTSHGNNHKKSAFVLDTRRDRSLLVPTMEQQLFEIEIAGFPSFFGGYYIGDQRQPKSIFFTAESSSEKLLL